MKPLWTTLLILLAIPCLAAEEEPDVSCDLNDLTTMQDGPMMVIYGFDTEKPKFVMFSPGGPSARNKTVLETNRKRVSSNPDSGLSVNNSYFDTVVTRNDVDPHGEDQEDPFKLGNKLVLQYYPIKESATDGILLIRSANDEIIVAECNKLEKGN